MVVDSAGGGLGGGGLGCWHTAEHAGAAKGCEQSGNRDIKRERARTLVAD